MACPPPKTADPGFGPSEPHPRPERSSVRPWAAAIALLALFSAGAFANKPVTNAAVRSCDEWHAEVVAAEGSVQVRTPNGWKPLAAGSILCTGDTVRVQSYSRAAIRLPDKTVLRLDQNTNLTFAEPKDDNTGSWVDVLKGVIHVISRDPRSLRFNTPYANAGLEGTEFVLEVNDHETDVTVVEGKVKLSNQTGQIGVPAGQRGSAKMAQAPASAPIPDPIDALRWTPHFVPILGNRLPAADQKPTRSETRSAEFFSKRAAKRLSVGQIGDARDDLARALRLDPANGDALALQALIALSEAQNSQALSLARRAVAASASAPAPRLAFSYAAEANGDLDGALTSAKRAAELAPENALAWARLAEMRLAKGDYKGGKAAAQKALSLQPDSSYAYTVLGFAHLGGDGTDQADPAFRKAVSLDPSAPLPRLGLALTLIRTGELTLGRQQLEIAVMLDPTKALSRSYMAKTYDAELRNKLSAAQLAIAKHLNGSDPTPWLYDALRKQNQNRPVDALHDLEAAYDRNDDQAVYRSRLLMDEDLAARSAGIGQIHRTLGFEQLALLEGWKSLMENPTDYSSHRLLSDVYSYLPRHEIARVDELFQSQLLQPLNVTPVRPQLGEANLFVLDTLGPSPLSFDDFHPLIEENGLSYQGSAVGGSNDTHGVDVAIGGLGDKLSYSLGWLDYSTDGFRANNDFHQRVANGLVQFRPMHGTSIFAELRSSSVTKGDLALLFDPTAFSSYLRQEETVNTARLGVHHELSDRNTLIGAFIETRANTDALPTPDYASHGKRYGQSLELQDSYRRDRWQLITGGRLEHFRHADVVELTPPIPGDGFGHVDYDIDYSSIYMYGNVSITGRLSATLGGSFDRMTDQGLTRSGFNPKLGLIWQPSSRTTVRAVRFKTLQGPFWSKLSTQPSLEPTEIAGFNQNFFGPEGEDAWRNGVAIDHRFSRNLFAGGEISRRNLNVPSFVVHADSPMPITVMADVDETLGRSYVYWTPSSNLALSGDYEYDEVNNHGFVLSDRLTDVRTQIVPLTARYFLPSGFNAGATATWVSQSGNFAPRGIGPDVPTTHGDSEFWTLDLSLGYRFRNRRGLISFNVQNALDKHFRFQDIDPETPRIMPQRTVVLRVSLAY